MKIVVFIERRKKLMPLNSEPVCIVAALHSGLLGRWGGEFGITDMLLLQWIPPCSAVDCWCYLAAPETKTNFF